MLRNLFVTLSLILTCSAYSQRSFITPSDTLNKPRLIGMSASIGTVWSGSMIGLWQIWYKDVEKTGWHTFDDSKNWLQMDKVGHFYTAYKLNSLCSSMYRWTGVNRKKSVLIGTGISLGYQATLEMFDAYSDEWGFSWADVTSNIAGTATYLVQDLVWEEERIIPKFSYHPTEFAEIRPEVLGSNFAESLLKDYNGQSYWLSFNLSKFAPESKIPKWLCVSFGYSAHAKLVGSEEMYYDPVGNFTYRSSREYLFSLDIDFSALNIKRPWVKTMVKQLNYLKIPFPTLVSRDGTVYLKPFYF